MKINLAENMLRFGVKNLNESAISKVKTLSEQQAIAPTTKPRIARSIYDINQLSDPSNRIIGPVYFKIIKNSPAIYLSTSTTFIKNVFGSGKTLLSLDLYDAVGTDDTNIKPAKSYGLVLRWTADTQVKYGMDKTIDNSNKQQVVSDTGQLNSTFDNSYFPMWSLNPNVSGAMTAENLALLITKAFKEDIHRNNTIKSYKQYIDSIMANLQLQPRLLTTKWDATAVERLKTALESDPELDAWQNGLIASLNA